MSAPALTSLSGGQHGPDPEGRPMHNHPTLFKLRSGQCRFPLGERWEPARFFCGKPALVP